MEEEVRETAGRGRTEMKEKLVKVIVKRRKNRRKQNAFIRFRLVFLTSFLSYSGWNLIKIKFNLMKICQRI